MDYAHPPITCRFCSDVQHKVRNYPHLLGVNTHKPSVKWLLNKNRVHYNIGPHSHHVTHIEDNSTIPKTSTDVDGLCLLQEDIRRKLELHHRILAPPILGPSF